MLLIKPLVNLCTHFQQVTITVLDENDNSPQFDITSDSAVNVAEDSAIGRRIAVVLARDPDAGSNGQVPMLLQLQTILGPTKRKMGEWVGWRRQILLIPIYEGICPFKL